MAERGRGSRQLTDSFIASSDVVYDLYCEVCADFNKHVEAKGFCIECQDFLCEDCVKSHGINRLSRNHVVQTKSQMPRQKPSATQSKSTTPSCTEKCDLHPERTVEYYCKDDGSLACTVCLVKHRQCKAVDHISDLSEHLLDSQDYKHFTTSLTNLKTQSKNVIKSAKDNTKEAEKLCADVSTALQELRGKVMKAFDEIEQNIKKQADKLKTADLKKMKDIGDKGTDTLDEVEKISTDLHSLERKKQVGQLFVRMVKLEARVKKLQKFLDEAQENSKVTDYTFESSSCIQEILDDPTTIGQLAIPIAPVISKPSHLTSFSPQKVAECPTKNVAPPIAKSSRGLNAEHIADINVKTQGDTKECWITGSVTLPNNTLILADCRNRKIKLLNLQTSKITSELKTLSKPWDVSSITEDQLATTLYDGNKIVFIRLIPKLTIEREITVGGKCRAIVHNNGKLIVAFSEPVKIEIMDLDGTVEKKIECSNIFKYPFHIALCPGRDAIYVTDSNGNFIKRLSLAGKEESVYEDNQLAWPRGVIVDQQGRVIVCGSASLNIHLLTPDLSRVKVLVDMKSCPYSLSLCNSTRKLYVGRTDNELSVYQLSEC